MFIVCCVRGGFSDKLIANSKEFYWECLILIVYDLETSAIRRSISYLGCCATENKSLCGVLLLQQLTASRIVCCLLIHYCANMSSPLVRTLSHMNRIHTFSISAHLRESIFILFSHLNLVPLNSVFSSGFPTKFMHKMISHMRDTCSVQLIILAQ